MSDLFYNGVIIGSVDNAKEFVHTIRTQRREGRLTNNLNISYEAKLDQVNVLTEAGRARRPLIIVEDGKSKLTKDIIEGLKKGEVSWSGLIGKVIEYLDAEE